ncbi:MAG: hypothetical protein Q4D60_00700 [Eubacteriales bacterium]|nr:hypothetical protein [Eubacteriales bacterium]
MLQIKKWGLYVLSSICLLAIMICVICDYALTKHLTWSLIVLLSLIAGWLVFVPFFRARSKVIRKSLIVISIITLPFLAGLSAILKLPLILSMGSSIAVLAIAAAWGIYGVFEKCQNRIFLAFSLSLLIVIPLACGITHITAYFIESVSMDFAFDLFHIISTLILSGACLMVDLIKRHRDNIRKEQIE